MMGNKGKIMKSLDWIKQDDIRKGLALGGGGARGCYEIGFWKAINENEIYFDAVSGTSIGALVGAFYVQNRLDLMLDFVEHLEPVAIAKDLFAFPETLSTWIKNRKEIGSFLQKYIFSRSGMDISPLKTKIDSLYDHQAFKQSPIDFACMTFNITTLKPVAYQKADMHFENAKDILIASASCYPAFPVLEMNGEQYIDGGYADNVPIDLVADFNCSHIFAIDVEGPGVVRSVDPKLDVFMMKPILPLMNFLDFTATSGMKNLQVGYFETLKLFQKRAGAIYTFALLQQSVLDLLSGYLQFCFAVEGIDIDFERLDRIARATVGNSKSDLSDTLFERASYGLLVELLAYLFEIDAYKECDVFAFLAQLFDRLNENELSQDEIGEMINQLSKRNISRINAVCLFQWIMRRDGEYEARSKLQAFASIYPNEIVLAWAWNFLQKLDHRHRLSEVTKVTTKIEHKDNEQTEDRWKIIENIYLEQLGKIEKMFNKAQSKNNEQQNDEKKEP